MSMNQQLPSSREYAENSRPSVIRGLIILAIVLGVLAVLGAWDSGRYYLVFHSIVELFSIAVAVGIFMIAWNVRQQMANDFLLFVAIAYAVVSLLDLVHTLTYDGMGAIPGLSINEPNQLWIAARYMQACCLLIAPLWLTRRLPVVPALIGLGLVAAALLLSIFPPTPWWPHFPTCRELTGVLTPFKVASEYVISGIFLAALAFLWSRRHRLDKAVFAYMAGAFIVTIASELSFSSYVSIKNVANLVGHLLKVLAVYLTYRALIVAGLKRPFDVLFRDLANSKKQLQAILDSMPLAIFLSDPEGNVVFTNPAVKRIWGIDEHVGRDQYGQYRGKWLDSGKPVEAGQWALARALETHQPFVNEPFEIDSADGGRKILHNFAIPIFGERGQFIGVVVVTEDVTERTVAQTLVRKAKDVAEQAAGELARSNKELEQFGYIVSHDLQEPLRAVTGFLQLLETRCGEELSPKAKEYIGFATDGAKRMSQLIRDLLEYSRVQTRRREPAATDVKAVFDQALANCSASIEAAQASVTCSELPTVVADHTQLLQLLQNLVANAVKFRRPDVSPAIHLTANTENGQWVFRLSDDGIGISQDQVDKVFELFHRLHSRDKYQGTGIGLAVCKKIVELHGGRIWAESRLGEGSTFCFTLPKRQEA